VAGIVFAGALTGHEIAAAQRSGAHVPAVVDAARLTYVAVAALGLLGVVACRWLARTPDRAPAVERDRIAA
jgi:hypothetical protein